ncbi:MAG: hypothetical protein INR69_08680 [Mucilaginibacter polytrichastri]|nr:hypothetical protein [Mucilaginibacter polytrichastri]
MYFRPLLSYKVALNVPAHKRARPAFFTFLFLLLLAWSSCRVQLVPEYSAALDERIVETAKLNDLLYLGLLDLPPAERKFSGCADAYRKIEGEINSIILENEARKPNEHMTAIVDALKKHFAEYRDEHRQKGTLSNGEIRIYQAQIHAFWVPLLRAERALKDH